MPCKEQFTLMVGGNVGEADSFWMTVGRGGEADPGLRVERLGEAIDSCMLEELHCRQSCSLMEWADLGEREFPP